MPFRELTVTDYVTGDLIILNTMGLYVKRDREIPETICLMGTNGDIWKEIKDEDLLVMGNDRKYIEFNYFGLKTLIRGGITKIGLRYKGKICIIPVIEIQQCSKRFIMKSTEPERCVFYPLDNLLEKLKKEGDESIQASND